MNFTSSGVDNPEIKQLSYAINADTLFMESFMPNSLKLHSDIYPGYLFVLDQNSIVILDVTDIKGSDPFVAVLSTITDIAIEEATPSAI